MKGDIPASMRFPRSVKIDKGEAWFYVSPGKIDLCVAQQEGEAATQTVTMSRRQLERALSAMKSSRRN